MLAPPPEFPERPCPDRRRAKAGSEPGLPALDSHPSTRPAPPAANRAPQASAPPGRQNANAAQHPDTVRCPPSSDPPRARLLRSPRRPSTSSQSIPPGRKPAAEIPATATGDGPLNPVAEALALPRCPPLLYRVNDGIK